MAKQNDNAETVEIRFVVTGRPDEIKILTAKWMRSNKAEVLEFLAQAKKTEIVTENGATPNRIHWAKIESAAFFRYLAEALSAQISADTGLLPGDCSQAVPREFSPRLQTPHVSLQPKIQVDPEPPLSNSDDFDDDDDCVIDID